MAEVELEEGEIFEPRYHDSPVSDTRLEIEYSLEGENKSIAQEPGNYGFFVENRGNTTLEEINNIRLCCKLQLEEAFDRLVEVTPAKNPNSIPEVCKVILLAVEKLVEVKDCELRNEKLMNRELMRCISLLSGKLFDHLKWISSVLLAAQGIKAQKEFKLFAELLDKIHPLRKKVFSVQQLKMVEEMWEKFNRKPTLTQSSQLAKGFRNFGPNSPRVISNRKFEMISYAPSAAFKAKPDRLNEPQNPTDKGNSSHISNPGRVTADTSQRGTSKTAVLVSDGANPQTMTSEVKNSQHSLEANHVSKHQSNQVSSHGFSTKDRESGSDVRGVTPPLELKESDQTHNQSPDRSIDHLNSISQEQKPIEQANTVDSANSNDSSAKTQELLSLLFQLISDASKAQEPPAESEVSATEGKTTDLSPGGNFQELILNVSKNHGIDPSQVADAVSLVMNFISLSQQASTGMNTSTGSSHSPDSVSLGPAQQQSLPPASSLLPSSFPSSSLSPVSNSSLVPSSNSTSVHSSPNITSPSLTKEKGSNESGLLDSVASVFSNSSTNPRPITPLNKTESKQPTVNLNQNLYPQLSNRIPLSEKFTTSCTNHKVLNENDGSLPSMMLTKPPFSEENFESNAMLDHKLGRRPPPYTNNVSLNQDKPAVKYKLEYVNSVSLPIKSDTNYLRDRWGTEHPGIPHTPHTVDNPFLKGNQLPSEDEFEKGDSTLFQSGDHTSIQGWRNQASARTKNNKYFAPNFLQSQNTEKQANRETEGKFYEAKVEMLSNLEANTPSKMMEKAEAGNDKVTLPASELNRIIAERGMLRKQMEIFKEKYEKRKRSIIKNRKDGARRDGASSFAYRQGDGKTEPKVSGGLGMNNELKPKADLGISQAKEMSKQDLHGGAPSIGAVPQVNGGNGNFTHKKRKLDMNEGGDFPELNQEMETERERKLESRLAKGKTLAKRGENNGGNSPKRDRYEVQNHVPVLAKPDFPPSKRGKKRDESDKSRNIELMKGFSVVEPDVRSSTLGRKMNADMEFAEVHLRGLNEEEKKIILMERERRMREHDQMLEENKLCLVLDLDHTLLNSAKYEDISPSLQSKLLSALACEREKEIESGGKYKRELYTIPSLSLWTKLRPGIWSFLDRVSKIFELHVYTMGSQAYASEIMKILDPSGNLFHGRVISRGDEIKEMAAKEQKFRRERALKKMRGKYVSVGSGRKNVVLEGGKEKSDAMQDDYELNDQGFLVKSGEKDLDSNETDDESEDMRELSEFKIFKDLDGVLGLDSGVLIIDDSASVWPHHAANLLVVERYMYFPFNHKQYGCSAPSLLESGVDEREADGMLASVLSFVEKVHFNFFSSKMIHDGDVRDTLIMEQKRILQGCKIVFSRIFPVGEANPSSYPTWKLAERLGATCTTVLDESVTHVIAISPGTEKVNWAVNNKKFVVKTSWLEASATLYKRANENEFGLV